MICLPDQIDQVFWSALQLPSDDERKAYLDRVCGGDRELRRLVEKLLRAQPKAADFLEQPLAKPQATVDEPVSESPGTVIGPYKLLEQIGEGGFGIVFMAEQQQPVRRKVALKVLKPGMDTKQVVARFEAERQAVALMDHPHIAHIFDGGETPSGRPYFVMELVRGIPITEFCDQNQMAVPERLELFVTVCQAVQHAHQKGIIHRDLKPSNVLVTLHDDKAVVKVIDFGIAKVTGQQLTEKTLFTNFAQMIGTPLYMSPEQAQMSGLDIDTRSDIYSLGVLLYELLTGTTPFDKERLRTAGYEEIRRIIREEEAAKPSTRINKLGQAATGVSVNRKSDPWRLAQLCRGELDWLVMKTLEKDRNRRYESASSFAADVQRYLHDEPVQACPPSALYRFRKFARRNKVALGTAAVVGLAMLLATAGLATSTVLIARQQQATATALQAETQARDDLERALQRERQNSYYQRIALADREWLANNLGRMEQLLEECPADLRGWEWHYLRRLRCKAFPLMKPDGAVLSVAVSPNGEQVASCSQDGMVKIREAKTGRELLAIRAHKQQARSVAFSSDGRWLASGSWDGTVKIWDVQTGRELHSLTGHQGGVWSVAFSADGKWLASAERGEVTIWDAATGQAVHTLPGHVKDVYSVTFSPDSQRLASSGFDKAVKLWDVLTGKEQRTLFGHQRGVYGVAFSPDGRLLASCGAEGSGRGNGELKVWNAQTGKELLDLRGHTRGVYCAAFSPDGRRLASGSQDQTVKLWDVATGQEALTLRGHLDTIRSVVFSPDGHRLFSCGLDQTVRVWDATPSEDEKHEECLTLRGHSDGVTSVAFSPQKSLLVASASTDGTVKLWNTRTAEALHTIRAHTGGVETLAFSPDGHLLATAGGEDDRTVKIWDAESGKIMKALPGHMSPDQSIAFFPDGRQIISGGYDRVVRIWQVATGNIIHEFTGHTWLIRCVACSPNGRYAASSGVDGMVRLWDVETRKEVLDPPLPLTNRAPVRGLVFSSDGKRLVSGGLDRSVKIWDTTTWRLLDVVPDPTGGVISLALSPDGQRVAWGATDSTVKMWDATTRETHVLRGHTNWVESVAFSCDGKQIASGSVDGTVKIWKAPPLPESSGGAEK
jgi:WD40 repeat protein/serine/threonine protein kinase